nr:MAG TPA: KilAC domain protein [Caudoviricetes sp.]
MNEVMKITINENQEPVISGRELHKFLEVKTPYTQWFERMCEYGFIENVDFASLSQNCEKPFGGRPATDHAVKLDMAKELAMIQRTERGKQASNTSILVGEMAKLLKQNGVEIGQRRLFEKLRSEGFLMKNGLSKNMPTQRAMDLGLFEIKEGSYIDSQGNNVVTRTVKVTGKGQVYFVNRYLRNNTELPIIQQA